jgi:hypothetical protein
VYVRGGDCNPKNPGGWSWLPPFPPGEEIAVRVLTGAAAAFVSFVASALALGGLRAFVAGRIPPAPRVLLAALGLFFAGAALQAFLDGPPRPHARWRRVVLRANRSVEIGAMALAAVAGASMAFGWFS